MSWGVDWRCKKNGCFNDLCRLKFQVFDGCFPRDTINFTDVDGLVEVGGNFCMLEWKSDGGQVKRGQGRAFENFTRNNSNVVFVVYGNAEDMSVKSFGFYWRGVYHPAEVGTLDDLKLRISKWAAAADERVAA
jgi:hypothetical protein